MKVIGFILIAVIAGLYLLWLYFSRHRRATVAKDESGVQVFNILVKGVYSPDVIKAKAGRPVRLNFSREEDNDCSRFVNLADFHLRRELPQGQTVAVEFIPSKKGEFLFTCDMSMYRGKLIVE